MKHVIQIRDLIGMLQQHELDAEVVGGYGSETTMLIHGVKRDGYRRRVRLDIEYETDQLAQLEAQIDALQIDLKAANELLEEFDSIMQAGGTPQELNRAEKELHEKVQSHLAVT